MINELKLLRWQTLIYLFSDFGLNGPYVGQLKSALYDKAPSAVVIDLMHDAPVFNSKASAHLLAAALLSVTLDSIVLAVVDPGVGSDRKGIVLRADSRWYVGPDNGLFDVVAARARAAQWYEIIYQNPDASYSFHGRDIFAPVAAMLHNEVAIEEYLAPLDREKDASTQELAEIIYIDRFGNLMSGLRSKNVDGDKKIWFNDVQIHRANTFSDVSPGEAFYYENSQGLLEIAINSGSAKEYFGAAIGDVIGLR